MDQELTPKEIVEKDFNLSMRGYNPTEVDEYLDIIIRDYDRFITEINTLRDRVQELEDELEEEKVKAEQAVSEASLASTSIDIDSDGVDGDADLGHSSIDSGQVTNFDILKRISNLERHVFGSKLNDE